MRYITAHLEGLHLHTAHTLRAAFGGPDLCAHLDIIHCDILLPQKELNPKIKGVEEILKCVDTHVEECTAGQQRICLFTLDTTVFLDTYSLSRRVFE